MSNYVMLPSDESPPPPRKRPSFNPLPLILILLVVAGASWWFFWANGGAGSSAETRDAVAETNSEEPQLASQETDSPDMEPAPETVASPVEEEPAIALGGVVVATDPAGAMVKLKHRELEVEQKHQSPATIIDLPAGFYEMTISAPGHKPFETTYEIVANKIREMEPVTLESGKGILKISGAGNRTSTFRLTTRNAAGDTEVVREGDLDGLIRDISPGHYQVTVTRPGWEPATQDLVIEHDEVTTVEVDFGQGKLRVESTPPGSLVWMRKVGTEAEEQLGKTPIEKRRIPVGTYELLLRPVEGLPKTLEVEIVSGKETLAQVNWALKPVMITSDPPGADILINGLKAETVSDAVENSVTPLEIELLEGDYKIVARYEGLDRIETQLSVAAEGEHRVHLPFDYGTVVVTSTPEGANVYQQNRLVGTTPLRLEQARPGAYQFKLWKERYGVTQIEGELLPRKELSLDLELNYDPNPVPGRDFTNSVGQRMVWIQEMNGWAAATEMTQEIYEKIMGENPSRFLHPNRPVERVSWSQAVQFCQQMTLTESSHGFVTPGFRYNLPTDAQWSYFLADATLEQAVTGLQGERDYTEQVATLEPNARGLYDVRGNVWEWCLDWYTQDVFIREQTENASGKEDRTGTEFKILRGGSWNRNLKGTLEPGYRLLADPNKFNNFETGFRVVMVPIRNGR